MTKTTAAYFKKGGSFDIRQIDPVPPKSGEVQIDVQYCGICGTDLHIYQGAMAERIGDERILGHEMSGVISAVGDGVDDFKIGDVVVVRPLDPGADNPASRAGYDHISQNLKFLGIDTAGAFQQKWTVPAFTVHHVPDGTDLSHAALVEPVAVACHDVTRGGVKAGEDVLVIGGGPIGILVAMVARARGANVTLSEVNEHRLKMANDMGFTTLNPICDDVAKILKERTHDKGMDVVFEVSGTAPGIALMTEVAAVRGRIVMVAIVPEATPVNLFHFFWKELQMVGARVYEKSDYDDALQLIKAGHIDAKTMITDIVPLENIEQGFETLTSSPTAMKILVQCN